MYNDASILFRSSFGADLDLLILLSSFARGSKLIFDGDLFILLDLHLKARQTWFCSSLTLESQSNLVLFDLTLESQSNLFLSTYLDLPSSASLAVLSLYRTCLPDWTYTSDARLVGIRNSLKILNLTKLSSFVRRSF